MPWATSVNEPYDPERWTLDLVDALGVEPDERSQNEARQYADWFTQRGEKLPDPKHLAEYLKSDREFQPEGQWSADTSLERGFENSYRPTRVVEGEGQNVGWAGRPKLTGAEQDQVSEVDRQNAALGGSSGGFYGPNPPGQGSQNPMDMELGFDQARDAQAVPGGQAWRAQEWPRYEKLLQEAMAPKDYTGPMPQDVPNVAAGLASTQVDERGRISFIPQDRKYMDVFNVVAKMPAGVRDEYLGNGEPITPQAATEQFLQMHKMMRDQQMQEQVTQAKINQGQQQLDIDQQRANDQGALEQAQAMSFDPGYGGTGRGVRKRGGAGGVGGMGAKELVEIKKHVWERAKAEVDGLGLTDPQEADAEIQRRVQQYESEFMPQQEGQGGEEMTGPPAPAGGEVPAQEPTGRPSMADAAFQANKTNKKIDSNIPITVGPGIQVQVTPEEKAAWVAENGPLNGSNYNKFLSDLAGATETRENFQEAARPQGQFRGRESIGTTVRNAIEPPEREIQAKKKAFATAIQTPAGSRMYAAMKRSPAWKSFTERLAVFANDSSGDTFNPVRAVGKISMKRDLAGYLGQVRSDVVKDMGLSKNDPMLMEMLNTILDMAAGE